MLNNLNGEQIREYIINYLEERGYRPLKENEVKNECEDLTLDVLVEAIFQYYDIENDKDFNEVAINDQIKYMNKYLNDTIFTYSGNLFKLY